MKAFIFLAEGFEEIEAVATIDVLRRGGVEVIIVSVTGNLPVTGAHGITVHSDALFETVDFSSGEWLILPGGMSGVSHLNEHCELKNLLKQYAAEGKKIAAICVAPLVLGGLGLLQGKKAIIYPGAESTLKGACLSEDTVVKDGNIITAKGPGCAIHFGLAILEDMYGQKKAAEIAAGLLVKA